MVARTLTTPSTDAIATLILAAGSSTRLGHAKQLVSINGQTLVERQIVLANSVCPNVYCILGANKEAIAEKINHLSTKVVSNEDWQRGMSTSIACGVSALSQDYKAVLIMLVDQWQLIKDDLNQLICCWYKQQDKIIVSKSHSEASSYQGPPVIFPKSYFEALKKLEGDVGAKPLIKKYKDQVVFCSIPNAQADLDTKQHLKQLQENQ